MKTGLYLKIDKSTETTYILKDNNKEQITIRRNHIVPYYPKEKHRKLELQNYLFTKDVPTLKKPNVIDKRKSDIRHPEKDSSNIQHHEKKYIHQYNLRKRKITII